MSLLERGNTRLAPLDTVEPDGYRMFDGEGSFDFQEELPDQASVEWSARYGRKWEPLYTHKTVESLLAEYRKQVLLKAADKCAWFQNEQERGRLQSKNMARMCEDELHRMAESDKTTMEGDKHES